MGRGDRLLALRDQEGLELVPELGAPAPLDLELDAIAEVLVPAGSRLIGLSLREIRFSQRFTSTVLAIRRGEDLLRDRLGQVKRRLGDALLLQTPRATLPAKQVSRDLLLLDGAV
ncbi:TrkA C-terminal domain-containing protein [Vulcanococcus limneticus]|uniref:TrkA C-terminal domain-containing protein n=1 Tax=Vulcanococcus limneticus TaxID=2170428 RepID=UPI00398BBFC7